MIARALAARLLVGCALALAALPAASLNAMAQEAADAQPAAEDAGAQVEDPAADAYARARIAYAARDFDTARPAAIEAAEAGEPEAMILAGLLLERGQGGPADAARARVWYERAAGAGQPDAAMALARLATESRGGLALSDARSWLRRAQSLGAPDAALMLGRMLALGIGGPPDSAGARAAFTAAATAGSGEAMRELALLDLEAGEAEEALAGLEQAAAMGDADAAFAAGVLWADEGIAADALERAAALFRKAAEAGHAGAATLYAHALYQGAGLAQDRDAAVGWYQAAAEGGDAEGAFYYAVMLFAGAGTPASREDAYYWALRSRAADPEPAAGYGPQRAALIAQAEAALDDGARANVAARVAAAAP